MSDLSRWTGPVDLGPFRWGLRRERDLSSWTDAELLNRARALLPAALDSWRYGRGEAEARALRRLVPHFPDVRALLSGQELLDLGLPP